MRFHSYDFIVFMVGVFCIYWLLPRKPQNIFLLGVSYFFYGYIHPWFLSLILLSTVLDYFCGLWMHRYPDRKKIFVLVSLIGNLGMLGVFKYFNFFIENVQALLDMAGLPTFTYTLHIFLPTGISFYTFQTLSYTLDIYRGRLEPRKNFIDFAVFVAFFPQLVAGPIERARRLVPQFEQDRTLSPDKIHEGLCLITWGFFKKLVIADTVATYANKAFALQSPDFFLLWAGTFAFTIQLYADFSAYTDIARGSARLLGFHLMRNFNHPYMCRSVEEFWQKWHISLYSWMRDYVLLSLRRSKLLGNRRNLCIIITFLLSGLWHGASWNFAIWGLYSGVMMILYPYYFAAIRKILRKEFLISIVGWLTMITVVIQTHMLLFREHDVSRIPGYLMLNPFDSASVQIYAASQIFILTLLFSLPLWMHSVYARWIRDGWMKDSRFYTMGRYYIESVGAVAMFLGILVLQSPKQVDFIYFQF